MIEACETGNMPVKLAAAVVNGQKDRVMVTLERAKQALIEAKTIQATKRIADIATAAAIYASRQKLGEEVISHAHEVKIFALRKLGEMLKETPKQSGGRGRSGGGSRGTRKELQVDAPPTLIDLGLDKKTSAVAQKLANLPQSKADAVAKREQSLTQVLREEKAKAMARKVSLPTAKFRVLYADPPWSYGNTQPDYYTEQRDHYPVMSLDQICALPVRDITEDNAVLFLWVTSPILEDSFKVIKAWGFEYKTSFVWDKVKHNMGHYNSVRHEFLLVCVRGSCQPDAPKLFDSVITQERGKHSEKPAVVYDIIETLYPHGKRIELFARSKREGWSQYGNEA